MDLKPLAGRTAVVTGGSGGIGQAIVSRLASDGALVVFSYGKDESRAKELVEQISAAGDKAVAVQANLTDMTQLEGLFTAADGHFAEAGLGGLDIFVNASGAFRHTPIGSTPEDDYDLVMSVNAKAAYFALGHAAHRMGEDGRIIGLSSVTSRAPRPQEAIYAASKAAVEQFTWAAVRELGERGIRVNVVSPGPTAVGMLLEATSDEERDQVVSQMPLGRLGEPVDVANVVAFLAGPDAGWVNGQNIRVDGGLVW